MRDKEIVKVILDQILIVLNGAKAFSDKSIDNKVCLALIDQMEGLLRCYQDFTSTGLIPVYPTDRGVEKISQKDSIARELFVLINKNEYAGDKDGLFPAVKESVIELLNQCSINADNCKIKDDYAEDSWLGIAAKVCSERDKLSIENKELRERVHNLEQTITLLQTRYIASHNTLLVGKGFIEAMEAFIDTADNFKDPRNWSEDYTETRDILITEFTKIKETSEAVQQMVIDIFNTLNTGVATPTGDIPIAELITLVRDEVSHLKIHRDALLEFKDTSVVKSDTIHGRIKDILTVINPEKQNWQTVDDMLTFIQGYVYALKDVTEQRDMLLRDREKDSKKLEEMDIFLKHYQSVSQYLKFLRVMELDASFIPPTNEPVERDYALKLFDFIRLELTSKLWLSSELNAVSKEEFTEYYHEWEKKMKDKTVEKNLERISTVEIYVKNWMNEGYESLLPLMVMHGINPAKSPDLGVIRNVRDLILHNLVKQVINIASVGNLTPELFEGILDSVLTNSRRLFKRVFDVSPDFVLAKDFDLHAIKLALYGDGSIFADDLKRDSGTPSVRNPMDACFKHHSDSIDSKKPGRIPTNSLPARPGETSDELKQRRACDNICILLGLPENSSLISRLNYASTLYGIVQQYPTHDGYTDADIDLCRTISSLAIQLAEPCSTEITPDLEPDVIFKMAKEFCSQELDFQLNGLKERK